MTIKKVSGSPSLEDTIIFATKAHSGQRDKGGEPYVLHPIRIMLELEDEALRMMALLHDVVEDTPFSLEELGRMGYSERVIDGIDALTRREQESYDEFLERILQNEDAIRVKCEDLRDNMRIERIKNPVEKDYQRIEKYRKALEMLESRVLKEI